MEGLNSTFRDTMGRTFADADWNPRPEEPVKAFPALKGNFVEQRFRETLPKSQMGVVGEYGVSAGGWESTSRAHHKGAPNNSTGKSRRQMLRESQMLAKAVASAAPKETPVSPVKSSTRSDFAVGDFKDRTLLDTMRLKVAGELDGPHELDEPVTVYTDPSMAGTLRSSTEMGANRFGRSTRFTMPIADHEHLTVAERLLHDGPARPALTRTLVPTMKTQVLGDRPITSKAHGSAGYSAHEGPGAVDPRAGSPEGKPQVYFHEQ